MSARLLRAAWIAGALWAASFTQCSCAASAGVSGQRQVETVERGEWLQRARWGVMTHFLADSLVELDGSMTPEKWNEIVDRMDVNRWADQLQALGADYFVITIGQNSGYFLAPNRALDAVTPNRSSRCSRRDLVAEMASALAARGVKLLVYLPATPPVDDTEAFRAFNYEGSAMTYLTTGEIARARAMRERTDQEMHPRPNSAFLTRWEAVIREWSLRWGTAIAGWWFDGCYYPNTVFRSETPPNFHSFAAAARAGNSQAVLAFSPGVVTQPVSLTPEEDFTAGEVHSIEKWSPGRIWEGRFDGVKVHVLSYLGSTWGRGEPRMTTEAVVKMTGIVASVGALVTWDVPLDASGIFAPVFVEQLKAASAAADR